MASADNAAVRSLLYLLHEKGYEFTDLKATGGLVPYTHPIAHDTRHREQTIVTVTILLPTKD